MTKFKNVTFGKNPTVWKYVNLFDCEFGDNVSIGSFTEIYGSKIGNDVRFQAHCFVPRGVTIGNSVFIGPRVTILNDKFPPSNGKHWKKTIIKDNVVIGGSVTILPGVTIGDNAFIGAGSVVTKNIPDNEVWYGNAAIPIELKSKYPLKKFKKKIDINFANFVTGFVDGEGCFCFYGNKNRGKKYLAFSFSLESDYRDKKIYYDFRDMMQCGNMYERRRISKISKVSCHYIILQVRKQSDLIEKIIPFFDTYQLNGLKKIKYQRWREKLLDFKYNKEKNRKYEKIDGKYKRKQPFYKKKKKL